MAEWIRCSECRKLVEKKRSNQSTCDKQTCKKARKIRQQRDHRAEARGYRIEHIRRPLLPGMSSAAKAV